MSTPKATARGDAPRKRRQAIPTSGYTKFAVTVPSEIAEAARKRVQTGRPGTMSALVSEALAEKLEQDDLRALLDEMETEFGAIPLETQKWADQVFDRIPER